MSARAQLSALWAAAVMQTTPRKCREAPIQTLEHARQQIRRPNLAA
jgi:hypothetical protein